MKRFFFACVVTWELLGNIRSEELGCRQSVQSAGVQSCLWLERLKLCGCCGRFRHKIYILKWVSRSNSFGPSVVQKFFFWHSSALHTNGKRCS